MKRAHHMRYRLLSGIKNGFVLKFSLERNYTDVQFQQTYYTIEHKPKLISWTFNKPRWQFLLDMYTFNSDMGSLTTRYELIHLFNMGF